MACNCKRSNVYVLATPYFNWEKYIDRYEFTKHRELSRPVEIYNTIVEYSVGSVGSEWEEEDNKILELCKKHRELGHKILVFVNSRSRARDYSRKIYQSFENNPEDGFNAKKEFLSRVVMTEDDLYGIMDQEDYLAYSAGITFHNASLPEEIRELIEKDFLDDAGCIDIVVATETLAYGLNSNVDVVIVAEMEKPVGRGEKRFLSVNEYQNFIGRAGRLGKKNIGYAYTFINSVQKDSWDELISKIASPDLIESQYKNIWEREECIFHLLNYFDSKDGTELDTVCSVLENYPYRDNGEPAKMETAIEDMQERHLIKSEVDELEEKELYSVTKIGRRALGFIVSLDTYDRLLDATKKLFKNKNIVMFDFIYAICQCKELLIRDYFNKDKACDYRSQFLNVVNKWQEDGVISKACRLSITSHPSFNKFKNKYNNPSPYDYTFLRQVRMAEALYMWIQCFSVEEIQRKCGFEYGNIKKIGEKAKYITDILSAEISVSGDIRELEISLKRLGLAFYYGIRTEIIEKLDVLELEPMDGRQLRTVGRVINIRENFSKAKQHKLEELQKQIESFPQQYQDLLGR